MLLNVPLAQDIPKIALHVFKGQSQPMAVAQLCVARMSSASKDSVLPAQLAAMDANTTLKLASNVLKDT